MLVWTNKSGYDKHCGRKEMLQTMNASVHHVQEVINVIESQLISHIIFTRSQPRRGGIKKAKNIMK